MFNNLLESKAKKQKSPGGMVVSAILHVLIIGLAIQATLNAGQKKEKSEEKVDFVEVKKDEPPPPKEKPPEVQVAPPPKGFQTLTAPVNIPDVLPDIDLSKKVTNEADFTACSNRKCGRRPNLSAQRSRYARISACSPYARVHFGFGANEYE